MIKQCKAYDYSKLAPSKLPDDCGEWYVSTKFDGHYTQIHVDTENDKVEMFTSGGKNFLNEAMSSPILEACKKLAILYGHKVIDLEGEYLGTAYGKLGDRGEAAVITTMRTEFAKGIYSYRPKDRLIIFDLIDTKLQFKDRWPYLKALSNYLAESHNPHSLQVSVAHNIVTPNPFVLANQWINDGWEGAIAKSPYHYYVPGKRVANAIKIKYRKTTTLVCKDVTEGKGKYSGQIGALLLEDDRGQVFSVGSGLTDEVRGLSPEMLIGKSVTISYERYTDTFIQPVIIEIGE